MADSQNPRLVFAGTPDFAARHLQALLESSFEPVAVYTQPDRPAGRGKQLRPSPVKTLAEGSGIPVLQPATLRSAEAQDQLRALRPDLLIVVAYGLILPQEVLDIPDLGCVNVHASLLPRWRGAAPIQRAIEAGDAETGITIMQMEAGLDTGPMLVQGSTRIRPEESAADLESHLAKQGCDLLLSVLKELPSSLAEAHHQDDAHATYAHKIEKSEAQLNWTESATVLARKVMAFNPFPGCWTELRGERLKVWSAIAQPGIDGKDASTPGDILRSDESGVLVRCGEDSLLLTELQLPGGRAMAAADLLRSRQEFFAPGQRLGG